MADLHLGYEAELRKKGAHIPTSEYAVLKERIQRLLARLDVETIILNGDVKHGIGTISDAEWRQIRALFRTLAEHAKVIVITGNHDLFLGPVAGKEPVTLTEKYSVAGTLFLHGDKEPTDLEGVERIVIGHEHPALRIRDGFRAESVKCYLVGTYRGKELIVLPSMFGLTDGTDVLRAEPHSPLLSDPADFRTYALESGEVLYIGTVQELRERNA